MGFITIKPPFGIIFLEVVPSIKESQIQVSFRRCEIGGSSAHQNVRLSEEGQLLWNWKGAWSGKETQQQSLKQGGPWDWYILPVTTIGSMGLVYLHMFTIKKQPNVGKYTSHMDPMCGIHIWLLHGRCRYLNIPYMDPMGISIANH